MNTKVEVLENSLVKLTVEVPAEKFEEGLKKAYHKMKGQVAMQGFRKGKAPRALIEKTYGPEIFYDDAINFVVPEVIDGVIKENNIDIAARVDFNNNFNIISVEKGKPFVFEVTVTVKPEITLGDYKAVEVKVAAAEVTEEEILGQITVEQEKNAREITITDRAVEPQDKVTIDFEGFIDGEAFPGGQAEDHELIIGSGSFIGNFEDQLIGKNIGEDVEVNVEFPADYQAEELAGKPALFKVAIKAINIKELPQLNDDFAADVSDFETLDEYKEDIKAKLLEQKQTARTSEIENAVIQKIVENAKLEVPQAMLDEQVERNLNDFANRMGQQGLNMDTYLQYTGQTLDALKENFAKDAKVQLESRLVLEAIAKAEDMTVTDEEVEEEITSMAERFNMKAEDIKKSIGENEKEMMKDDLKISKSVKLIVDSAIVTE
ncbi:MAG TPA: trigger factor [Epulopiscium sp.]|nr:trigger factor [Candidatus Epulonipiscium sp.]